MALPDGWVEIPEPVDKQHEKGQAAFKQYANAPFGGMLQLFWTFDEGWAWVLSNVAGRRCRVAHLSDPAAKQPDAGKKVFARAEECLREWAK